jgi:hypothetical protein
LVAPSAIEASRIEDGTALIDLRELWVWSPPEGGKGVLQSRREYDAFVLRRTVEEGFQIRKHFDTSPARVVIVAVRSLLPVAWSAPPSFPLPPRDVVVGAVVSRHVRLLLRRAHGSRAPPVLA